jgi:hypothetical protein
VNVKPIRPEYPIRMIIGDIECWLDITGEWIVHATYGKKKWTAEGVY